MKIVTLKNRIEKLIGKHISVHKNCISIGFDTSVHSTGIAIIETTDTEIKLVHTELIEVPTGKHADMAVSMATFKLKLHDFREWLELYLEDKDGYKILVIEETFFSRNAFVFKVLSRFGGIVYGALDHLMNETMLHTPLSARAVIGFKKDKESKLTLKSQIIKHVNKLMGLKLDQDDIADAVNLAVSGVFFINKHQKK